jgi:hypothetical protein
MVRFSPWLFGPGAPATALATDLLTFRGEKPRALSKAADRRNGLRYLGKGGKKMLDRR